MMPCSHPFCHALASFACFFLCLNLVPSVSLFSFPRSRKEKRRETLGTRLRLVKVRLACIFLELSFSTYWFCFLLPSHSSSFAFFRASVFPSLLSFLFLPAPSSVSVLFSFFSHLLFFVILSSLGWIRITGVVHHLLAKIQSIPVLKGK